MILAVSVLPVPPPQSLLPPRPPLPPPALAPRGPDARGRPTPRPGRMASRGHKARQEVYSRYLDWLLSDGLPGLQSHVERNVSDEFFRRRTTFQLETCAIVSGSWLLASYNGWKTEVAGELPAAATDTTRFTGASGEHNSLSRYVRHYIISRTGKDTEHVKRRAGDTLERFTIVDGGLQSLCLAMETGSVPTRGAQDWLLRRLLGQMAFVVRNQSCLVGSSLRNTLCRHCIYTYLPVMQFPMTVQPYHLRHAHVFLGVRSSRLLCSHLREVLIDSAVHHRL